MKALLLALALACTGCSATTSGLKLPTVDVVFPDEQATLVRARYFAARADVNGYLRLVDASGVEFARVDVVVGVLVVADLRTREHIKLAPGDAVPEWAVEAVARLDALAPPVPVPEL